MLVIGVTGGVGTGKSTVAQMFRALGAVVLDADAIAREVVEPQRLAWRRIVKTFGDGVLNDDRTVNRAQLASRVFADPARRRALEDIIHPQVLRRIKQQVHRLRRQRRVKAVVLDVPLLLEANAQDLADAVVVVTAPPEAQRRRLRQQHGWSEEEIAARRGAQWELSAKVALADHVIDNGGSVEATRTQVKRLWNRLVAR
jgi:dephospho-CoA kinase